MMIEFMMTLIPVVKCSTFLVPRCQCSVTDGVMVYYTEALMSKSIGLAE